MSALSPNPTGRSGNPAGRDAGRAWPRTGELRLGVRLVRRRSPKASHRRERATSMSGEWATLEGWEPHPDLPGYLRWHKPWEHRGYLRTPDGRWWDEEHVLAA